jgi:ubiquitin
MERLCFKTVGNISKFFFISFQMACSIDQKSDSKINSKNSKKSFPINILFLMGQTIVVEIEDTDTIEDVKYKIQEKEGTPPDQQQLAYAGGKLEDDKTVGSYKIAPGAKLHLILRLRGGMYHYTSGKINFETLTHKQKLLLVSAYDFNEKTDQKELRSHCLELKELVSSLLPKEQQQWLNDEYESAFTLRSSTKKLLEGFHSLLRMLLEPLRKPKS